MRYDLSEVYGKFSVNGEATYCERYGEGHINDTYLLVTKDGDKEYKYLLQRVNNGIFKDVPRLMNNIKLVTDFAREKIAAAGGNPDRETMTIIPAKDGKPYYCDGDNFFRIYKFIDRSSTYQISESPEIFYQSAVAFGRFASMISEFDASQLFEPIARFHDTRKRFADFKNALEEDKFGKKEGVKEEIEFALKRENIIGLIVDKLQNGEIPSRVTHNDTKLNNVLFDEETGKSLAVIDLDTIMAGSVCYDFGDSIRFGCNTAAEDERDLTKVNFDINLFDVYAKGYLTELKDCLTQAEFDNMALGAIMMTYECGIRFLEDYLRGDVYFRTSREGHNLDRARVQFKLVAEMEKALPQMNAIVKKYAK